MVKGGMSDQRDTFERLSYGVATYGAPTFSAMLLASWWADWIEWQTASLLGSVTLAAAAIYRSKIHAKECNDEGDEGK
jgi:hypothetical protein